MIKFSRVALGAALLAVSSFAAATVVSVDAKANSIAGGSAAATGVTLTTGESFSAIVEAGDGENTTWKNDPAANYVSTANGDASFGTYTIPGTASTFTIGTLVGEIGSGDYFKVGTGFTGLANATGELKLFYWDSDAGNNSGALNVAISAVPESTNVALMALALGAFALTRRRKA